MSHIRMSNSYYSAPASERGMVLIIGLVMVLLMTIVGLAAIRGSGLQENMAGNMRDRNIAFQSAESVMREGEAILSPSGLATLPTFNCDKGKGTCLDLNATPSKSVIYMTDEDWALVAKESTMTIKDVAAKPSYLLEELNVDIGASAAVEGSAIDVGGMTTTGDPIPYRVSAKGYGLSQDAEVILQSTYKRRFK